MKIAVIGSGNVGLALGQGWASRHEVVYGVRDVNKPKPEGTVFLPAAEAAAWAEVVVLAIPWQGAFDIVAGLGSLAGKIVIDCTNPLAADLSGLTVGHTTSAAEQIEPFASGSYFYKAFNQTGSDNMANPAGYSPAPVMFVCGDDATHKPTVLGLVSELGFDAVDAGPLSAARLLEPLAMLWIHLAYSQQLGRNFAFALLRR